jgi:hypothetical protein
MDQHFHPAALSQQSTRSSARPFLVQSLTDPIICLQLCLAAAQAAYALGTLAFRLLARRPTARPSQPSARARCTASFESASGARRVDDVGLAVARAFHIGRPVFAALAEGVLKRRQDMPAPTRPEAESDAEDEAVLREELDAYFPRAALAPVTTHLLIPLAPPSRAEPTIPPSRTSGPRLPLAAIHAAHGTHALRVRALFARLDAARVWAAPGVRCAGDGVCAALRITFDGWGAARVRAVLGDAGRGWVEVVQVERGGPERQRGGAVSVGRSPGKAREAALA